MKSIRMTTDNPPRAQDAILDLPGWNENDFPKDPSLVEHSPNCTAKMTGHRANFYAHDEFGVPATSPEGELRKLVV
jgi:hypothetical protein